MAKVGELVQYFDMRPKYQFGDSGAGPYAAVITAKGQNDKYCVWVLPSHEIMQGRLEKDVGLAPSNAERAIALPPFPEDAKDRDPKPQLKQDQFKGNNDDDSDAA